MYPPTWQDVQGMYPEIFSFASIPAVLERDMGSPNDILNEVNDAVRGESMGTNLFNISQELANFSQYLHEMMTTDQFSSHRGTNSSDTSSIHQEDSAPPLVSAEQWRSHEKARRDLAAKLISLLTLLMATIEDLSGRLRFACRTKLQCADVLIVQGNFAMACELLLSSLENICNSVRGPAQLNSLSAQEILENSLSLPTLWSKSGKVMSNGQITIEECISAIQNDIESRLVSETDLGQISSDQVTEQTQVNLGAWGLGETTSSDNVNVKRPEQNYWVSLRYGILRKLMLCSRVLEMRDLFSQVSLNLLSLDLNSGHLFEDGEEPLKRQSRLLSDVLKLTGQSMEQPETKVLHSLSPFFEVSLLTIAKDSITRPDGNEVDNREEENLIESRGANLLRTSLQAATLTNTNEIIKDESYRVQNATYEGGRSAHTVLKLRSRLPLDIDLNFTDVTSSEDILYATGDNLVVGYGELYPFLTQTHRSPMPRGKKMIEGTSEKKIQSTLQAMLRHTDELMTTGRGFHATPVSPISSPTSSRNLQIRRGEQLIFLELLPPRAEAYAPLFIMLKVNGLTFLDLILPPKPDEITPYFTDHRLLNFNIPSKFMEMRAHAPICSPLQVNDEVGLSFALEPGDILESLSLTVTVEELSTSSSITEPLNINDVINYGIQTASAIQTNRTPVDTTRCSKLRVEDMDKWRCIWSDSKGVEKEIPCRSENGAFYMTDFTVSQDAEGLERFFISIPFSVGLHGDTVPNPKASFVVSCHFDISLRRNGCLMDTNTSVSESCVVHTSKMATSSCRSQGLVVSYAQDERCEGVHMPRAEFFACCTFQNTSPLPLRLTSFEIIKCEFTGEERDRFGRFEVVDVGKVALKEVARPQSELIPYSNTILLPPGHEYSVTLRLRLVDYTDFMAGLDVHQLLQAALPQVSFTYLRCETENDSTPWISARFNKIFFQEIVSLVLPSLSNGSKLGRTLSQEGGRMISSPEGSQSPRDDSRVSPLCCCIGEKNGLNIKNLYFSLNVSLTSSPKPDGLVTVTVGSSVTFCYSVIVAIADAKDDSQPCLRICVDKETRHWIPIGRTEAVLTSLAEDTFLAESAENIVLKDESDSYAGLSDVSLNDIIPAKSNGDNEIRDKDENINAVEQSHCISEGLEEDVNRRDDENLDGSKSTRLLPSYIKFKKFVYTFKCQCIAAVYGEARPPVAIVSVESPSACMNENDHNQLYMGHLLPREQPRSILRPELPVLHIVNNDSSNK